MTFGILTLTLLALQRSQAARLRPVEELTGVGGDWSSVAGRSSRILAQMRIKLLNLANPNKLNARLKTGIATAFLGQTMNNVRVHDRYKKLSVGSKR